MSSRYTKTDGRSSLPIAEDSYKNIIDIAAGLSQLKAQFAALYSFHKNLGHLLDKEQLLFTIAEHAKDTLMARHCAIYEFDAIKNRFALVAATAGADLPKEIPALIDGGENEVVSWIEAQSINNWSETNDTLTGLRKYFGEYKRLIATPLVADGTLNGFMIFLERNTELGKFVKPLFDSEDKQIAEMIAHVAANAILLHRLRSRVFVDEAIEQELETAARIQQMIMPNDAPNLHGWDIGFAHNSATRVNGDYLNFYQNSNGVLIVIADVMGHGVPAAMFTSALHIALLDAIGEGLWRPSQVIENAASKLEELFITTGTLVSILAVHLPKETGKMLVSSAGAPLPMIIRNDELIECKIDAVPILGATHLEYNMLTDTEVEILPQDIVVLFTDGILDALSDLGARFGTKGIFNVVKRFNTNRSATALASLILEHSQRWSENSLIDDDRTVVVLRNLWNEQ